MEQTTETVNQVTALTKTPEPSEPDSTHFGMTRSKLQNQHRYDMSKIEQLTKDYSTLKHLDQ
jgi:hypothetical protein